MTTPSRAMHVATSYHVLSHRLPPATEADNTDEDDDDDVGCDVLRHMSLSQPCNSGTLLSSLPFNTRRVHDFRRCQRQA